MNRLTSTFAVWGLAALVVLCVPQVSDALGLRVKAGVVTPFMGWAGNLTRIAGCWAAISTWGHLFCRSCIWSLAWDIADKGKFAR